MQVAGNAGTERDRNIDPVSVDPTLADAIPDRVKHSAHQIQLKRGFDAKDSERNRHLKFLGIRSLV
jgi:hypothetical protein